MHAIMECPHAAALWSATREVWEIPVWRGGGRRDCMEQWLLQMSARTCEQVLMIAWRI
jgi:hypothetical protein